MSKGIQTYNDSQSDKDREVCELLSKEISRNLPEADSKVWHGHPVWFLDDNPVAGYSTSKSGVRLLFWSGQSFDEEGLQKEGKHKAAQATFTSANQVNMRDLERWLEKSREIQWDYRNIVKRKGVLERLK